MLRVENKVDGLISITNFVDLRSTYTALCRGNNVFIAESFGFVLVPLKFNFSLRMFDMLLNLVGTRKSVTSRSMFLELPKGIGAHSGIKIAAKDNGFPLFADSSNDLGHKFGLVHLICFISCTFS